MTDSAAGYSFANPGMMRLTVKPSKTGSSSPFKAVSHPLIYDAAVTLRPFQREIMPLSLGKGRGCCRGVRYRLAAL